MRQDGIIEGIEKMKREKDVLILAHYYVDDSVQQIADFVGDSYYLSQMALSQEQNTILFCGVKFMGESAKILNPEKKIIMADILADCPMAHMVKEDTIYEMRSKYEDLAVVCYVNSTAELKALSDVCVTSSNAVKIVGQLDQENILFVPDENLGRYVQSRLPEKNFIFVNGFCHVHAKITESNINDMKRRIPESQILVHPECTIEVSEMADYVGSTSGIINYATQSDCKDFIICTEMGIFYELQRRNPNKNFYYAREGQVCPDMKRIDLQKIHDALLTLQPEVYIDDSMMFQAKRALENMHRLAEM